MSRPNKNHQLLKGGIPKVFLKPRYDGYSIANVPETVAKLLGAKAKRPLLDEKLSQYDRTENIVFLLLDGFGSAQLKFAREQFGMPSFNRLFSTADQIPITSIFPSTTSSAMASLHTGLTPQEHGIVGYTMFISELGVVSQMLRFAPVLGGRSLFDNGLDPRTFLGAETIHERLGGEGISSTIYVPNHIIDSGLSRITYRGAYVEPTVSFGDTLIKTRKNLERDGANSFHLLYHASPDTISHARGPYSEEFAAELESLFALVERQLFSKLDKQIGRRTILLVSGDHGAVNVNQQSVLDVADHDELSSLFRLPPTGDSRASILNLKPGAMDKLLAFFEKNYPGQFQIMESQRMLSEGYFGLGKVNEATEGRIGDVVAVPRFDNAIDNSQIDSRREEVPGRHGGLSEEEMRVPLILTKLSA